jgi:RNA polymerase sigma-70 factor, ECF subfamily
VQDDIREPASPADRELVGRYATAFENADMAALVALLLCEDALLEMPPQPGFAACAREEAGGYGAHGICVLTVAGTQVSRIVSFNDPELLTVFGFPPRLPARVREPVLRRG